MNKIIIILSALVITGCTPGGLKDCRFYKLTDTSGVTMNVARCPMSMTGVRERVGKSDVNTIVIDNVEYVRK